MRKITEAFVNCVNTDNSIYYGGFYHICGKMLKGESAWVEMEPRGDGTIVSYWNKENTYEITKDYHISFGEEAALLEKGFPLPVLQIEIEANIPWVLDEECSY